jgi:hypothetical protein
MVVDTPTTPTTGCYVVVGRTIPVVQQQQGVLQSLGWPSEQCQGCNNGNVSIVEPLTDQGMNGNGLKGWHAGGGGGGGYLQLLLSLVEPASSSNNWMMLLLGRQYHHGGMEEGIRTHSQKLFWIACDDDYATTMDTYRYQVGVGRW